MKKWRNKKMENTNTEETKVDKTEDHEEELVEAAEKEEETIENHGAKEALDEVKEEESYKDKYYYLAAEIQNLQKRFEREKDSLIKFGHERVMGDLIDVIDNFERTLGFIEKDEDEKVQNIVVGIKMISKMFLDTLEKHGLKQIEALGKEFDPNVHEAMSEKEVEGKTNKEVVEVFQSGYTLNGRVLRAAKVVIAKS